MKKKSIIWAVLPLVVFLLFSVTSCKCSKEAVAVLISTNLVSSDDIGYHSVWWYDTVLMYELLKEKGYNRIYILYGNGTDFSSTHHCYNSIARFGSSITDFTCDRAHIKAVFESLASGGTVDGVSIKKLEDDGRLFVWWMGHGGGSSSTNYTMAISHKSEIVTGNEFYTWVNGITNYSKRSIHVMTCHAGCYLSFFNVAGNNTVAEASSDCLHSSYEDPSPPDVNHAEYSYWLYASLREKEVDTNPDSAPCLGTSVASDANNDGKVSLAESFHHILAKMTTSIPQQADPDSIAAATYCK
jgi:hypothetical protein